MPAKKRATPAAAPRPPAEPDTPDLEPDSSEQVMVVAPAPDEPVRRGGYVLTDKGWVVDDSGEAPEVPKSDESVED